MNIKLIAGTIGGIASYILGGFDLLIKTLIILAIVDYVTGASAGFYAKKLSSKIGFKGICKKITMFAIVALASQVDKLVGTELLRNITIMFYLSNEGISILENAVALDLPVPSKLRTALEYINKKDGDKDGL